MPGIVVRPVSASRLDDLRAFSQRHGKFGYCSCMRWRMASTEFKKSSKVQRRQRLEGLVRDDQPTGLLAYRDAEPVGWCALAPRADWIALERSRILPRVDQVDVWCIVCFYIAPEMRRGGVQRALVEAAVDHARRHGADALESYPVGSDATLYRFMGSTEMFSELGFDDITPPGQLRTVMRRQL